MISLCSRHFVERLFKLQMFQEDMGSFMVMFLTTIVFLFAFSWLYNAFLSVAGPDLEPYVINGYMDMKNSTFMKVAACGTWLGDFFTAWMVQFPRIYCLPFIESRFSYFVVKAVFGKLNHIFQLYSCILYSQVFISGSSKFFSLVKTR